MNTAIRKSSLAIMLLAFATACAPTLQGHEVSRGTLTVHYAGQEVIQKAYEQHRNMLAMGGLATPLSPGTVIHGFFNPATNELWCPGGTSRSDFETCGHELRHWVDKQAGRPNFHQKDDEHRNSRQNTLNRGW